MTASDTFVIRFPEESAFTRLLPAKLEPDAGIPVFNVKNMLSLESIRSCDRSSMFVSELPPSSYRNEADGINVLASIFHKALE